MNIFEMLDSLKTCDGGAAIDIIEQYQSGKVKDISGSLNWNDEMCNVSELTYGELRFRYGLLYKELMELRESIEQGT